VNVSDNRLESHPLSKRDNPKKLMGDKKVPMNEIPPVAAAHISCAFLDGALKYGFRNWRKDPIEVQTYIAAAMRHLEAWAEGEECAPDSGLHHLAHAGACICILLDAQANDVLIDNRVPGAFAKVLEQLKPWVVARRKKAEEDREKLASSNAAGSEAVRKENKC
jgi:hypothetical protein